QFWLSQNIFGDIGLKPVKKAVVLSDDNDDKINPFPVWQLALIGLMTVLGLVWIIFEPAKIISEGSVDIFNWTLLGLEGNNFTILLAIVLFLFLLIYRLLNYSQITKEKMIAVSFFAFLTIFFWAIFEQSPGTLTIFANDYTDRVLEGNAGLI